MWWKSKCMMMYANTFLLRTQEKVQYIDDADGQENGRNLIFIRISNFISLVYFPKSECNPELLPRELAFLQRTNCKVVFAINHFSMDHNGSHPDEPFHNSRASKSGDRRISFSSGMSFDGFWSSSILKGFVGRLCQPYLNLKSIADIEDKRIYGNIEIRSLKWARI